MQIKLLLVLLSSLYVAKSYKILVYSAPLSFSHIQFVGRIADILQEAGHDVVIYELPDYMKEKMSTKQFNFWDKNTGTVSFQKKFVSTFTQLQVEVCDLLLSDNHTMDELRNKHFDVGITEMLGACGFGLFDKIGVDHIICASAVGVQSTMNNFFDMPHLTSITPTHPKLLCFVSHAGLNSVLELTRSGKPSILVPIFGDQFGNARIVESKNTTIVLMKGDFNNKTFEAALSQIVYDESFAMRAKRLASLMVNKPFPLKERLVRTVEFSTKHGKIDNLDIYGNNFNAFQYYSIDVIAFLTTVTVLAIIFIIQLCKCCFRVVSAKRVKKD
ncbi:hypothetical protein ANCCEY_00961 [Ancylostoma ceylanicum]|uniref:glucuronosyltransferase n=1 Tax=Ancylostoma ceylanicum TaxID=53326 RepID=A0A0D6M716_9BILA|nr:hypothetical protein ANCCEY_00961 [Ancylostoma ceylanicum]